MVNAPVLREAALFYAETNLPEISQQVDFQDTMSGKSDLAQVPSYPPVNEFAGSANAIILLLPSSIGMVPFVFVMF